MSESLEGLRRKIDSAAELGSVVRTMKALAASGIVQYERAVLSLNDYFRTVELGLIACMKHAEHVPAARLQRKIRCAVVFGSDQGLVGQFNERLADFVAKSCEGPPEKWLMLAVGERIESHLAGAHLQASGSFAVPNSIAAITSLVAAVLTRIEALQCEVFLFHNKPVSNAACEPVMQRLLPLDDTWQQQFTGIKWPTNNLPEVAGSSTLEALIREYLFISLFRACAESLAGENASRLAAMQRAEKNIDDLLAELGESFNRQRQNGIDEELFDVIAGFEALTGKR